MQCAGAVAAPGGGPRVSPDGHGRHEGEHRLACRLQRKLACRGSSAAQACSDRLQECPPQDALQLRYQPSRPMLPTVGLFLVAADLGQHAVGGNAHCSSSQAWKQLPSEGRRRWDGTSTGQLQFMHQLSTAAPPPSARPTASAARGQRTRAGEPRLLLHPPPDLGRHLFAAHAVRGTVCRREQKVQGQHARVGLACN